ncbi:unnamed protein product [Peniophora sp. CBMAI 1063]|nr:unnamed protein product [Peniophora sp. CBMAI 1063]
MSNIIEISSDSDSDYVPPPRKQIVANASSGKGLKAMGSPRKASAAIIELTDSDSDSDAAIPTRVPPRKAASSPTKPSLSPTKPKPKPVTKTRIPSSSRTQPSVNAETPLPRAGLSDIFRKPSHLSKDMPKAASSRTPSVSSELFAGTSRPRTPSGSRTQARTSDRSPEKLSFPDSPVKPARAPVTPSKRARQPTSQRSPSKKALAAAAAAHLAGYASDLFAELNTVVFKGGLPASTELKWSPRLRSTAGRARWHRTRGKDGSTSEEFTEIELASKIVDCEERVRNTLAHEMCHLACWVIDKDVKEGHGSKWKSWASKVMRARRDISISTRHHYEISYKYQWECDNCSRIYGRHSNSIRPDEVLCGACKTGHLAPLFGARNAKAPASPRKGKKPVSATSLAHALDGLKLDDLRYNEDEVEDLAGEMRDMDFGSCASDDD